MFLSSVLFHLYMSIFNFLLLLFVGSAWGSFLCGFCTIGSILLLLLFHIITACERKITFSHVPVTPRVRLHPIALDLRVSSQGPRCSQKRSPL